MRYSIKSDEAMRVRVGERIKQVKEHYGLTLQAIGDVCGTNRQHIWTTIEGKRTLSTHRLCLLAAHLGISVEWFLADDPGELKRKKPKQISGF